MRRASRPLCDAVVRAEASMYARTDKNTLLAQEVAHQATNVLPFVGIRGRPPRVRLRTSRAARYPGRDSNPQRPRGATRFKRPSLPSLSTRAADRSAATRPHGADGPGRGVDDPRP